MIQSTRGEQKAVLTKQSSQHPTGGASAVDAVKSTQTAGSRSWSSSALKNPRIVRVSRTFGGKDRHSKVRTIRGLRDRRVRLSVPTAIQLYDLQDRLGLSQPSKVVDWLLNAAQHEIDKLPPLEMLQLMGGGDHHDHLSDQLPPQPNSSTGQLFDFGSTCNPVNDHYTIRMADGEKAQEAGNFLNRSKESNERNIAVEELGHGHGFVLENSNPNNYYSVESSSASNNANNNYLISQSAAHQVLHPGYHRPIAILASYMAAASNYNVSVAAAASQNVSSGGLKIMHEASNISVPGFMAHDLSKDTAAASRVLRHQY